MKELKPATRKAERSFPTPHRDDAFVQVPKRALYALSLLALMTPTAAFCGELAVRLSGIRPHRGKVQVWLYDQANGFPDSGQRSIQTIDADTKSSVVHFRDLPSGSYAAFAFQDLNDNGKMDRNFLGLPKEPYGFSNGARGTMGPPSFSKAAISVDANASTSIALK